MFAQGAKRQRRPELHVLCVLFCIGLLVLHLQKQDRSTEQVQLSVKGKVTVNRMNNALPDSLQSLKRLNANIVANSTSKEDCLPKQFGQGWGAHELCTKHAPSQPCIFYSFGAYKARLAGSQTVVACHGHEPNKTQCVLAKSSHLEVDWDTPLQLA